MDAFKSALSCLIPGLKRNRRQEEDERQTKTERRRELMKQISRLKISRDYNTRKDRIIGGISFDYARTIVVWVQDGRKVIFRSDIVEQAHSYGEVVFVQDRWMIKEDGVKVWRGALVGFKRIRDAEKASLDLPQQIKYVRSTMLKTVVDTLIDCELLRPERSRDELSKVAISRKVPLRATEIERVHGELSSYGCLQTFFYKNASPFFLHNSEQAAQGWSCEVAYPYLAQAFLAMIMTDGLMCGWGTIYSSFIVKAPLDWKILTDAMHIIVFLTQSFFPKYVRSTMLKTVVDTLIDSELLHPDRSEDESSKVVISRKVPLRVREVDRLHRALSTYGCLQTFCYYDSADASAESHCEVTYSHLTQAYLAVIMTNGYLSGWGAIYKSSVEKTRRDNQILDNAKECIVFLAQCCFPK